MEDMNKMFEDGKQNDKENAFEDIDFNGDLDFEDDSDEDLDLGDDDIDFSDDDIDFENDGDMKFENDDEFEAFLKDCMKDDKQ